MSLTPDQLAFRKGTIGSSEIAAVCGLNPWQSQHDVYCEKLGLLEFTGNVKTRMGERIEHAVAEEYILETGATLEETGTVVHPQHPWMSATPDRRVVGAPRLLEIKCVGWRSALHWGNDPDAIPDYYRPQVEWQMEVCDVEETHVSAWIGGSDFRIYTIKRDRELAALLRNIGEKFWRDHVLAKVPPAVDGSDGARRMLSKMFPFSRGEMKRATGAAAQLGEQLAAAKRAVAESEAWEARIGNQIRELIADADGIEADTWKATYRSNKLGVRSFKFTDKTATKERAL